MAAAKPGYPKTAVTLELTHEEADALMQVLDRVLGDAPARIACDRVYVELYRLGYRARSDDPGTCGCVRFILNEEVKP